MRLARLRARLGNETPWEKVRLEMRLAASEQARMDLIFL
jgi:hypothetical protein